MIDPQTIAFVALAGLMGHALTLMLRNDEGSDVGQDEEPDGLWSSERFNQSGEGHNRPFFLE
ncbi:hypothetical protein [Azospirillum isscasi]|uniref:Uncharacterized protein n=1 Tax=Azospirillum isscasi TaxID=3053926 RepID=A0ABU0WJJ0_9PROT|nr:hypothetical protein [Azospirillum isscasi]MDQ2103759.1 hypothetical protein [Azospirillum isscasi]